MSLVSNELAGTGAAAWIAQSDDRHGRLTGVLVKRSPQLWYTVLGMLRSPKKVVVTPLVSTGTGEAQVVFSLRTVRNVGSRIELPQRVL
jgi:hypothetical protein